MFENMPNLLTIPNFVYAVIMIIVGFVGMRLAGRKSLSKMTIAQTVIMIAVGSILVEPVKHKSIVITVISIFLFVIVLIVLEYIAYYFEKFERLYMGTEKVIIRDGEILHDNLKKLRMTNDVLNMTMRLQGVSDYSRVKLATLETNGHVAIKMYEQYDSVSKGDIKDIQNELDDIQMKLNKLLEGK